MHPCPAENVAQGSVSIALSIQALHLRSLGQREAHIVQHGLDGRYLVGSRGSGLKAGVCLTLSISKLLPEVSMACAATSDLAHMLPLGSSLSATARSAALLSIGWLLAALAGAQVLPAYALFDGHGKKLSHERMLSKVATGDIVLFGEEHNNPIAHWLQLVVARDLAARGPLVMGAEMIEADDQATLDLYLHGGIDQAAFDTLARLWPNYRTDYAPLVDLAKEKGLPFVAANVPRRYARAVSRGGFAALDTLPIAQRAWLAPLPIAFDPALPGYVKMLTLMEDHGTPEMVQAQALKDATMAHFIAQHAKKGVRFLHFNGSFHSDFHEGIGWYLQRALPELKRVTITTVSQEQLKKLEPGFHGQADIIICVDPAMTRTH